MDADDDDWEGKVVRTGDIGMFPKLLTKGWESVAAFVAIDMASVARVATISRRPSLMIQKRVNRSKSFCENGKLSPVQGGKLSPVQGGKSRHVQGGKLSHVQGGKSSPVQGGKSSPVQGGHPNTIPKLSMEESQSLGPLINGLVAQMAKVGTMKEEEEEEEEEEESMRSVPSLRFSGMFILYFNFYP